MVKRPSYEIRKEILRVIKEGPLKYSEIERKLGTNYDTVVSNCEELASHEYVEIDIVPKDPSNGKPSYPVKITSKGREYYKKIEKNN